MRSPVIKVSQWLNTQCGQRDVELYSFMLALRGLLNRESVNAGMLKGTSGQITGQLTQLNANWPDRRLFYIPHQSVTLHQTTPINFWSQNKKFATTWWCTAYVLTYIIQTMHSWHKCTTWKYIRKIMSVSAHVSSQTLLNPLKSSGYYIYHLL
jgi:hypothetical protein